MVSGAGGLCLHSICPWPGDPQRLAVGVSAAGVWITEDGGQSWRTGYTARARVHARGSPRGYERALRAQHAPRADASERLFMQFHGNVYRSDDEGSTWNEIRPGRRAGSVPLVIDLADADSAYVIPLVADVDRVTDAEVRVYETRDAGGSWTAHGEGLPSNEAYLTVLRQAFGRAGEGRNMQLYFEQRAATCSARRTRERPGSRCTSASLRSRASASRSGLCGPDAMFRGATRPCQTPALSFVAWHRSSCSTNTANAAGPLAQAVQRLDRAVGASTR